MDTYLAPFIRKDKLNYRQVKQAIQKFIFNLNTTSRWGGQSPFTNLTFDLIPPEHIAKEGVILDGQIHDSCYGEYEKEMEMINKAFLETMLEGDFHGRIFSFPIPTYNVTKDFPWDSEVGELLLKLTAKYGVLIFKTLLILILGQKMCAPCVAGFRWTLGNLENALVDCLEQAI